MPHPEVIGFQHEVKQRLAAKLPLGPVELEWRAFDSSYGFYGPRLDVAVGPFATGTLKLEVNYSQMVVAYRPLLERLWQAHIHNLGEAAAELTNDHFETAITANRNAGCFMAIEIENRGTRKHLMGSALSAAALGRVTVAIGWTDEKMRAFARLRAYLAYLREVDKPPFDVSNLLIVRKEQLWAAITP